MIYAHPGEPAWYLLGLAAAMVPYALFVAIPGIYSLAKLLGKDIK